MDRYLNACNVNNKPFPSVTPIRIVTKMETDLKEQIVKSAAAIKRKVEMIKEAENMKNSTLDTIFKPIVDPLKLLAQKNDEKNEEEPDYTHVFKKIKENKTDTSCSSSEDFNEAVSEQDDADYDSQNQTLVKQTFGEHNISDSSFQSSQSPQSLSWSVSSEAMIDDIPFGIRKERGKLWLGKTMVYDDGHTLKIGNRIFKKTIGLKELLFKKKPNLDVITDVDLNNYKSLLLDTNAHRRDCDPTKPIKCNKGFKYMSVIKPLFQFSRKNIDSEKEIKQGKGIKLNKTVKKDTDYIYWDDPNELVERLKLLIASRDAGNTGLENEIIAIIEELHEAGIINKI